MKILFHINSLGLGGAERVVSILTRALSEKGYDIVLATEWVAEKEYPMAEAIHRRHVGLTEQEEERFGRIKKIVLRHTRLRACIKREKPDLVISFCNKSNFRCAISMLGMKIPLLTSVRNDPKRDYAPFKRATSIMEKKAAACVFQTPDAMAFFAKDLQSRSKVILNPLSEEFLNLAEALHENIVYDKRKKEIVTVGRIMPQKNHQMLLRSFARFHQEMPDYVLKLYGAADDEETMGELKQIVQEYDLTDCVRFMGTAEPTRIHKEIYDAAMFVLSSDYEGMPNALIEAMVLGLPCISTDCPCGGPNMLIDSEKQGILVSVGDQEAMTAAMLHLAKDPSKAEEMGRNAMQVRNRVRESVIIEQWISLIHTIVSTDVPNSK